MKKISVLLLTQNSEKTLKRTLDSCQKFNEVVIVDGGSTDSTEELAKQYSNVTFHKNPWPGFIAQRNHSIDCATHEWCFMIDSDEAATPELVDELYRIINLPDPKVLYRVMRTEYFLGKAIENGFGKSSYQERLFQKKRVRYGGGNHHSHFIDGEYVALNHPLTENIDPKLRIHHDPDYGLEGWLFKLPRFSFLVANEKIEAGKTTNAFMVLMAFFGTFFQIYRKSWREGRHGFVIALLESMNRGVVKIIMYAQIHILAEKDKNYKKKYLH